MALFPAPAREVQHQARRAMHETAPWVQRLARMGYAAKGMVYLIVGGLAAQAAFGPGERVEGTHGALGTILEQPFGKVLLGITALGLAGYVLWKLVQALLDPEHKGGSARGAAERIGFLISAAMYAILTLEAVRLVRGSGGGESNGAQHWTATIMDKPFGRIAIGLVGAGIAAYGMYKIYLSFASDMTKRLDLEGSSVATRRRVAGLGRAGTAARGVVFGITGWLVMTAALRYDPSRAQGLEGALGTLQQAAYGPWLLGLVAIGLFAYGIYQIVKARYRVIRPA